MSFVRRDAPRWHREVPGARWFRADLHVHTIDDLAGGRAKMPPEVRGDPSDPGVCREYAKAFLRGVVRAGVQVLGLTPHAIRVGETPETSAVWQIVDVWNTERDGDGVPFRDKVYAVFPGFEPSLKDGREGLHLLFLFDPEIGRDLYSRAFSIVMGGASPYRDRRLQMSSRTASEAFRELHELMARESRADSSGSRSWDMLILAPHVDASKGLFGAQKAQVLELFEHAQITGLELPDNKLPEDLISSKRWLSKGMERHHHAFFHASDAYRIAIGDGPTACEVGHRTTWFKLASPRIEALRQAFIASDSRLRIAFERDETGQLKAVAPPDPFEAGRRWLRRVRVRGKSAFFHRSGRGDGAVSIDLSPDLTCIIGGSMTGKSTLLDGLRVFTGAELPSDRQLEADVLARGRDRFLAGQPEVALDTPGDTAGPPRSRWPAVFFTQNELQRLVREASAVRDILARLVPEERDGILQRDERVAELDRSLGNRARAIERLLDELGQVEQLLSGATRARKDLEAFESAGLKDLQASERIASEVKHAMKGAAGLQREAAGLVELLQETAIEADVLAALREASAGIAEGQAIDWEVLHARFPSAERSAAQAAADIARWAEELAGASAAAAAVVARNRRLVERKLADMGVGAEKLVAFKTLGDRASKLTSYQAARDEVAGRLARARTAFEEERKARQRLVDRQREAFDRIGEEIASRFDGRIEVRREACGIGDTLGDFLMALKQKGITGWWRGLDAGKRPSPDELLDALQHDGLQALGCSRIVAERLRETLVGARRYELAALRSPDRYVVSLRIREGEYREIGALSGGRRVSVLLSLLLDAHDERPLVIDQPEDELDNRFLWDTVLPALRRLKGRRQLVVATHDANIVVNGDADLVVALEADADHGHVAVSGAIETPEVRRAIVETVDGGERAFALRKAKYGF